MKKLQKTLAGLLAALFCFLSVNIGRPVAYAADLRSLVDSQALIPTTTGYAPCDERVAEILAAITSPQMDTYDKLRACYDFLVNNCAYNLSRSFASVDNDAYQKGLWGAQLASEILNTGLGVCDNYSCAFAAMARQIGLNAFCVSGQTKKSGGGYTPHTWCVMNLGGGFYFFDPDLDDVLANGGKANSAGHGQNQFYYFGKTDAQDPARYVYGNLYYPCFLPYTENTKPGDVASYPTKIYERAGVTQSYEDVVTPYQEQYAKLQAAQRSYDTGEFDKEADSAAASQAASSSGQSFSSWDDYLAQLPEKVRNAYEDYQNGREGEYTTGSDEEGTYIEIRTEGTIYRFRV